MGTVLSLRDKLYDYIRVAEDKKLQAIYNLLEDDIANTNEWWKDKKFIAELDRRNQALESGTDKGFTIEQLTSSVNTLPGTL